MNKEEQVKKIQAFNMALDAIKIKFNAKESDLFAAFYCNTNPCEVREMPYFTIGQMYNLWELMDATNKKRRTSKKDSNNYGEK